MQPDAVARVRGAHRRTATGAGAGLGRSSSPSSTRRAFGSDPVGWNAETAHAQLLKLLDAVDTVRDGHAWPASTRDDSSGSYLLRVRRERRNRPRRLQRPLRRIDPPSTTVTTATKLASPQHGSTCANSGCSTRTSPWPSSGRTTGPRPGSSDRSTRSRRAEHRRSPTAPRRPRTRPPERHGTDMAIATEPNLPAGSRSRRPPRVAGREPAAARAPSTTDRVWQAVLMHHGPLSVPSASGRP